MRLLDAYAVLGVSPSASQAELKAAHRRLVRRHHPDLQPPGERARATRRMQEINVAYGLVRDPAARASYDRLRRMQAGGRPATVDVRLAEQWDDAMQAAGRWAARWWSRHRQRLLVGARRTAMRGRRAGLDIVGRVLWLVSCVAWGVAGLAVAVAAQRVLGIDGWLAPPAGLVAGTLVGSQRGWHRRLRLAGIPTEASAARSGLLLAGGALGIALLMDAAVL